MEQLIDEIYSEFDPSIVVRSAKHKSFYEKEVKWKALEKIQGIRAISKGVEALAVLEYNRPLRSEKSFRVRRTNAKLFAIEESFLKVVSLHRGIFAIIYLVALLGDFSNIAVFKKDKLIGKL